MALISALGKPGQGGLCEFQDLPGYTERPYLNKKKNKSRATLASESGTQPSISTLPFNSGPLVLCTALRQTIYVASLPLSPHTQQIMQRVSDSFSLPRHPCLSHKSLEILPENQPSTGNQGGDLHPPSSPPIPVSQAYSQLSNRSYSVSSPCCLPPSPGVCVDFCDTASFPPSCGPAQDLSPLLAHPHCL